MSSSYQTFMFLLISKMAIYRGVLDEHQNIVWFLGDVT